MGSGQPGFLFRVRFMSVRSAAQSLNVSVTLHACLESTNCPARGYWPLVHQPGWSVVGGKLRRAANPSALRAKAGNAALVTGRVKGYRSCLKHRPYAHCGPEWPGLDRHKRLLTTEGPINTVSMCVLSTQDLQKLLDEICDEQGK
jgi:hypothetical protein